MWILIIGLIVLTAIAMAVGYARNKKIQKKIESGELQAAPEIVEADAECCGQHEICEKESLLAAVSKKVEYYDDEELDRFRGHSSDGYSEEEIEEKLNVEKNIAPSTILTLLTRLEKKGFIQKVRNGKSNLYVPLVEKENYIGTVGKNMLDKMFQGSLAKFASSLYDGEKLSSKEVKQLQEFIDRQK